jgi:hypothetical protein
VLPSLAFLTASSVLTLLGTTPPDVYVGRERQLGVRVPRIDETVVVDGRLDEAAWKNASLLTGFSQFAPSDGVPAADSTHVLVWYSPTAIHFGIRAFEQHGIPHATLADRDRISADDNVQILLGTFRDQRQALLFAVNPFGVQMDGTIVESGQSLSGGLTANVAHRVSPDLSQDFVFSSKGRVTPDGYEVEIRIPFKSIRYQSTDKQSWDINVVRQVQHSGYEDSWAPAKREHPSFLAQGGSLDELQGLERGLVLDLNPIATQKVTGAPGIAGSGWSYNRNKPELGGNLRWGVSSNLTLNATARPDFAEVESDAGQIIFDPRNALFFPEKRPFFLDGIEQFSVPSNLIYTRRIGQPVAAAKLTGKVSGTTIAVLSAVDDTGSSGHGDNAIFNILRAQRDIGGQSRIGVAYTDRILGSTSNRVADVDGRFVSGMYSATFQLAGSHTKLTSGTLDGPLWNSSLTRSGKRFVARYSFSGSDPDFRTLSGFISRAGLVRTNADHRWTFYGDRGSSVERFTLQFVHDLTFQHERFVRRGDAQDKKFHLRTSTNLKGGWVVGLSWLMETFGFDPQFYSNYSIERTVGTTVDTIPFVGVPRIPNRDYVIAITTPRFARASGDIFYVFGQDENFFEWAQADIHIISAHANLRPTDQLRMDASFDFQDYLRRTDGSRVGRSLIPRVKAEYQVTRSIFVRAVGEYQISENDDLRDETRTNFPLLINGVRALASRSGRFNGDYLFSYTPNPGTVVFLGYGSQALGEPDPTNRFAYQPLVRANDHFFVKLSYLFRM